MYQDYPKWIDVDGPGHPQNPGKVLVNNEDEEREAKSSGKGPSYLNPPPDADQKSLDDMERDELVATLSKEGYPDDASEDELRKLIKRGRKQRAEKADQDEAKAREVRAARERGGDHGDGLQTDQAVPADPKPEEDAKGEKIAPRPDNLANNVADFRSPAPKSEPASDARPVEARDKVADDKPAGNVIDAAATPPDHTRGPGRPPRKSD